MPLCVLCIGPPLVAVVFAMDSDRVDWKAATSPSDCASSTKGTAMTVTNTLPSWWKSHGFVRASIETSVPDDEQFASRFVVWNGFGML